METATKRVFETSRRARVSDCGTDGFLRIDAIARYLQDIGYDDTHDIGVGDGGLWVARDIAIHFPEKGLWPKRNEIVELKTYCEGVGRAFAQRKVILTSQARGEIDGITTWVHVDETGKPSKVPDWLDKAYPDAGKTKLQRKIDFIDNSEGELQKSFTFNTRVKDFDVNGHANNTIAFEILLEILHREEIEGFKEVLVEFYDPIHDFSSLEIQYFNSSDNLLVKASQKNSIVAQMRVTKG